MVTRTLVMRELYNFWTEESVVGIGLWRDESDIRHHRAIIIGPATTPYEGGLFLIDIYLPDEYPFKPPIVKFMTKVWHPNIGSQNGVVSLNALKGDWTAAMNLTTTLISLQALLSAPELSDPQDDVVALQYLNDYRKFVNKARRWTRNHAIIHADNLPPLPQHNVQDDNAAAAPPQHRRRVARIPGRLNDYMF